MALDIILATHDCPLGADEERHVHGQLERLGQRLAHFPAPKATAVFKRYDLQRRIEASLRIELGPHGGHLVSHQTAETVTHAVRLAVEDVERQLERHLSRQRGEHTYGVPSRRLPKSSRPHPP